MKILQIVILILSWAYVGIMGTYAFGPFLLPIVMAIVWYFKFLLLVAGGLAGLFLYRLRSKLSLSYFWFCFATLSGFFFLLISVIVGHLWLEHKVILAKAYPAQVEAQLESYKKAHGHYPDRMDDIPGMPTPPDGLSYWRENDEFGFSYPDFENGFFASYEYSSATHKWVLEGD